MLFNVVYAIHILPLILSLFRVTTALSQPAYHPPVVRSLELRDYSHTLPDGWTVTLVRPGSVFLPMETAAAHIDVLYAHVLAVARDPHSALSAAVAFRIGSFDLVFRADDAVLSWSMIENFCLIMQWQAKTGIPMEFEAVFTHDIFKSWVVWVKLSKVAEVG